jgi:hypothetical protein
LDGWRQFEFCSRRILSLKSRNQNFEGIYSEKV